ncbi:thiamine pyrophosphate-dependent dehydrogenase E1 component subunit alpha [Bradyrhizobium sp.]|uniref:thiamine pyrophosphate-dependent dehydrogenase E1 component subunit alpha n=1 Tax=Bradyrhizobium sp. TaxID=376 RepID=UPI004037770B
MLITLTKSLQQSATDRMLNHYRSMVRIRAFECGAEDLAAAGNIHGMIHSAVGQEAVAVGVCANLRRDDLVTSTHRNHHHALAKGVDAEAMMAELLGRASGTCGGKGGSMHIADFAVGMIGANGVVAASVAIAAGAAQALRSRGSNAIAVAFFGDGGMNRGQCLEAMNYAAVFQLPVLLVCEDNGWAATTRGASVSAGPGTVSRANALGIPAVSVDGNDVAAVEAATHGLVLEIRAGGGPRLLHCLTYRLRGHTCADKALYRAASELELRQHDDPLTRCANRLAELGVSQPAIAAAKQEEELVIQRAVEAALAAPWPPSADAFRDVQDIGAAVSL